MTAVWLLIDPFADGVEHVAVQLTLLVADGWVVESAEDIVHDFVDGDSWVLPGVEDTTGLIVSLGIMSFREDHPRSDIL